MSKKRIAMVCGQVCEAPEGDYYVTCSFDSSHVILRSRLPYHIVKCVKQHPGHNKIQCPFDATEYIDSDKYETHILNCESRRSVVDEKFEAARLRASGQLSHLQQTPFFHVHGPMPDEDWGGSAVEPSEGLRASGQTSPLRQTPFYYAQGPKPDEEWGGPAMKPSDDNDFNEDLFNDIRPVGRGTRSRHQKKMPNKGLGRGETLKRIFDSYNESQSSTTSLNSSSSSIDLRKDISINQFEDE